MLRHITHFVSLFLMGCLAIGLYGPRVATADVLAALESCFTCHGPHGASTEPDIPIIGGYSAKYMVDTMAAYRNNERPCHETDIRTGPRKGEIEDMCVIARNISESDTKLIAEHLATEPFVRARQYFNPDKARLGKATHDMYCVKCHEDGGASPDDDAGILAGQWMPYVEHQMEEFATGRRPMPEKMKPKFEKLDEADIENILHYFASFQ